MKIFLTIQNCDNQFFEIGNSLLPLRNNTIIEKQFL